MLGYLLVKIQSGQEYDSVHLIKEEISDKLSFVDVKVKGDWIVACTEIDSRIPIWQLALDLEVKGEIVGYGFGPDHEAVTKDILQMLVKRGAVSNSDSDFIKAVIN
ncbi:hypothetical protein GCM10011351_14940 [Paraliobacillus quinghaiensis]|uniref:Uncharacterized protein n=1 Tax=Paraliobacillus quinghaiensis TaxID=470815 RepID=A0A917TN23_9BACI|nr:hypothetical protein [Paraliobacillus quinghaiensis]GGM29822.1 hypothetical protein GCM10011351_14940 [Paraliobacillus quinghaiensis]